MKKRDDDYNGLFRKEFLSFEPDPPEGAWEKILSRIRPGADEPEPAPVREILWVANRKRWLYPVLLAAGSLLLFVAIWLSLTGSHQIKGKALTGQEKLLHGTAYLFHVQDTHLPRDSVRLVDAKKLDPDGSFTFNGVSKGTYFVRIHVHPESPAFPQYRFGYSGNQLQWDDALLMGTDTLRDSVIIHLPKLTD